MLAIGLHGGLRSGAPRLVPAGAGGLQLPPQLDRAPALFSDAADEPVDKSEFSLQQRERYIRRE